MNESRQAVSQRFGRDSFETRSTLEFLGGIAQMRDAVLEGGRNVAADLSFRAHIAGGGGGGSLVIPAARHRTARTPGGAVPVLPAGGLGGRRCLRLSTLSSHGCLPDVAEVTIFHPINAARLEEALPARSAGGWDRPTGESKRRDAAAQLARP